MEISLVNGLNVRLVKQQREQEQERNNSSDGKAKARGRAASSDITGTRTTSSKEFVVMYYCIGSRKKSAFAIQRPKVVFVPVLKLQMSPTILIECSSSPMDGQG